METPGQDETMTCGDLQRVEATLRMAQEVQAHAPAAVGPAFAGAVRP